MSRKTQRVVLKSQAREIISKVYAFMKSEANNKFAQKLTDARWRTAQAVGVSESTVTRVLREKKAYEKKLVTAPDEDSNQASTSFGGFTSPMKKRKVKARKINLDEFEIGVVRRTIEEFHREHRQFPTLLRLHNTLRERIQFDGCKTTLRTLLHKLGYKWSNTENKRKILTEKHKIQLLRLKYLKQVKSLRNKGKPIVYTDESYIHLDHDQKMSRLRKGLEIGIKRQLSKGDRIIVVHAGSAAGFVPNSILTYSAGTETGDYNSNMNSENYLKWLKNKLIPNLPKDAVVVMDDAAYHNSTLEKMPTTSSKISEMQSWLTAKNIPYDTNLKKIELYDIILKNKERFRKYKVDELLKDHGFAVLRLPPYHPELNPIENIWDIVKNYVASSNIDQNNSALMPIINEAFQQIHSDVWAYTCRNIERIEDDYLKSFDLDYSFVINECDSSDSESGISETDNSEISDAESF